MDHLMALMFGEDFFEYTLDAKKTCHVQDDFHPKFQYNREEWRHEYADMATVSDSVISVEKGKFLDKAGYWWFEVFSVPALLPRKIIWVWEEL